MAFEVVKAMEADDLGWGEDYRPFARAAVAEVIEDQMALAVDRYLEGLEAEDASARRNGHYRRHLLTTLGDIELRVPRTRRLVANRFGFRLYPGGRVSVSGRPRVCLATHCFAWSFRFSGATEVLYGGAAGGSPPQHGRRVASM
jgi:Transposase, Mutator family